MQIDLKVCRVCNYYIVKSIENCPIRAELQLQIGYRCKSLARNGDSPGCPVVRTPCFQCRGQGFDPSSGKF